MRMFAGFGAAEDTNARFRQLLDAGQTGLSIAYDMPTLYGYDTDDPEADGEFGTCGVAVSSLADMEVLLDGLPLDRVSTSMTINSPAAPIWAMYIVAAEKAGVPRARLEGTLQNDILKEFVAQKEFLFPPAPSMRLVTDTIEFGTREMPRWNTVSISGYHIREAGSTAVQELAFTIADGMAYVEAALARGLRVDDFAPRLSFFFNSHSDFFEEIAKFRAARRIWWKLMTQRYRAENERSTWMRFHTQTAGVSLAPQQPLNNLTRVAVQALAAVLGGTHSLHTDSYDEALAVPTAEAALLALRQQQIIAEESGVDADDPTLAGIELALVPVGGVGDLVLGVALADRRDHPAPAIDLVDVAPDLALDLGREGLDEPRAAERIDGPGHAGLLGDDLLLAQREQGCLCRRHGQGLVVRVGVERLRAAQNGGECLERDAGQVVERLLRRQ
jgi:methylmalonyl-CoA mutase N-terminal domain/subunit